jgi:hypothetical protein
VKQPILRRDWETAKRSPRNLIRRRPGVVDDLRFGRSVDTRPLTIDQRAERAQELAAQAKTELRLGRRARAGVLMRTAANIVLAR